MNGILIQLQRSRANGRENDWSLAAGRYKPVTATNLNHDAPADILREIITLEEQIAGRAKGFHSVLK